MGEISDLRTQILDNIQVLYPDFKTDARFILTCNIDDGHEEWTVILGRPILDRHRQYADIYGTGIGGTPEAAYRDLLKNTAMELHDLGYTWNW
ncbi:hypothetical protein KCU99_g3926, partial [Aureobasidium melanogenum]